MSSTNQIKIGALISYFTMFFNIVSGIIYTPWMVKHIGVSNYGLYILVTTFISYFLLDFGLGHAIARYVSKYKVEQNFKKINQLLGISTKIYLVLNLVLFLILFVLYFFIQQIFVKLSENEIELFKDVYLIAGGFALISFPFLSLDGIILAHEKFIFLKGSEILSKIVIILGMVFAIYLGYDLFALILVNTGVGLFILLLKIYFVYKKLHISIDFNYKDKELLKELFSFSIWTTIIAIAQRLLINIAPLILGIVSGTNQIAIFSVAVIIEGYTWTLAHALNGLFLAKITHLHSLQNNTEEITKLMIKVGRTQLMIMSIVFIGLVVLGDRFIVLWMGEQFENSYLVMLFLVLPGFITLTQEIAQTYLVVVNKLRARAILFVTASILSVVLSFGLAPKMGALGCAIGIFIATIIGHVIGMNFIYNNVLKLDIFQFFKKCYGKLLLPIFLTLLIGIIFKNYILVDNWIKFLVFGIVLVVFYSVLVWFLALEKEEKVYFIENVFYKFIKK